MLELKDIRKIYRLDSKEIAALDGIDLKIEDGEFVAIIGASGSGKSTLLNILGCLDSASSGEYFIDGKNVSGLSMSALSRVRGKKIGFVFQNFSLVPTLTAYISALWGSSCHLPLRWMTSLTSGRRCCWGAAS